MRQDDSKSQVPQIELISSFLRMERFLHPKSNNSTFSDISSHEQFDDFQENLEEKCAQCASDQQVSQKIKPSDKFPDDSIILLDPHDKNHSLRIIKALFRIEIVYGVSDPELGNLSGIWYFSVIEVQWIILAAFCDSSIKSKQIRVSMNKTFHNKSRLNLNLKLVAKFDHDPRVPMLWR
ncbi:unnamed protein product [Caenorhabditis angaria]|uniref:Uncharacterized protein n=1 Tax=Caenorhabditis angaria TaxID=860376 RepID=A0A9P1N0Y1_9PELO|nr:unnamed protein product [Caenorhabditis angaria]